MKYPQVFVEEHPSDEIAALVQNLHETHRRLMELTGGELDSVLHPSGQSYLLREAQEKLQRSEAAQRDLATRQMAILNAVPAQIALLDPRGAIISSNDSWKQFAAASDLQGPDFGVGDNYLEICGRVTSESCKEAHAIATGIRAVLRGETRSFSIEYPRHSPAEHRWFRLVATPLNENHRAGAVVMHIDITDAKKNEERLRLITDLVPHGIFAKDAAGRHIFANPALAELAGLSIEEVLGKTDFDLVSDKAQAEAYLADDRAVMQSGSKMFISEEPRTDLSGRTRFLQTLKIPFTVAETGERAVLGVCIDITERKRVDGRFRRLVDSNVQGVFFWNTNGKITGANDAFLAMVGYTREDLDAGSMGWAQMTPPEYAEADQRALAEAAATGICKSYEKEYIRKDGSRVPILLGAAMFEDNPQDGVCFVLDLTERKKLEHQFLRAQRMESIGTLAGGIAHDLNNILAPILMSIDILRDASRDPQATAILETIETSAKRGADIVRQVLSFARGIEGERIEIQTKHLLMDLESIIRDTFPKDIRLHFAVSSNPWTILGDPTQVHQILLNLCVNARDAMPQGGRLNIAVENAVLDEHYAAMNLQAKPGNYVNINVTDTGVGIPPEIIEKIFEPFFTTKEVGKGTGLGLSTVIAIVKSHGGFVNVYSEPGKGTTFKLFLPAIDAPSGAASQQRGELSFPRGSGEMILLVDDEPSLSIVASQTLQAFGYRVLCATDGADAVAVYLAHRNEVALVLTDMMMPVMDGPAMIHALRRVNPEVKIIATSGLNANYGLTKLADMRIKHFLTKPYTAETLLKTLRAVLEEA
jgi:PAS domain S-box-containing protein